MVCIECRPVVADSHHFDEGQDPDRAPHHSESRTGIRIKVKSGIRVRIKIKRGIRIRISIRINVICNTNLYCGALYGGMSLASAKICVVPKT
jgi:hypothetical protein